MLRPLVSDSREGRHPALNAGPSRSALDQSFPKILHRQVAEFVLTAPQPLFKEAVGLSLPVGRAWHTMASWSCIQIYSLHILGPYF